MTQNRSLFVTRGENSFESWPDAGLDWSEYLSERQCLSH